MSQAVWEVRNGADMLLGTYPTEQSAWHRIERDWAKARRQLNKPGLHGGIDPAKFCERYVVKVSAAGEPHDTPGRGRWAEIDD